MPSGAVTCPGCQRPTSFDRCYNCGYQFPPEVVAREGLRPFATLRTHDARGGSTVRPPHQRLVQAPDGTMRVELVMDRVHPTPKTQDPSLDDHDTPDPRT